MSTRTTFVRNAIRHPGGATVEEGIILPGRPTAPDLRSQLAAIVEHSKDAIFSRTFDGVITTWNNAAERIFGYTAEEIVGRTGDILLPRGGKDEFPELFRRLRSGHGVANFEAARVRKDGRVVDVSLTLSPIRDAARRLIGFSTIARDVTDQQRMRATLERREMELNDLFEETSIGLVLLSPAGRILRANRAFLTMLECPGEQVLTTPLAEFHSDEGMLKDFLERLARHETLRNISTEFRTAKGETRHVLVDADGLWDGARLIHTRWFVRDISRRRQLERELLQTSDNERRHFAQELHDGLGQQLGGIAYLVNVLRESLLERQVPEAAAAARIFELVRKAIDDTRRMARGLSPVRPDPDGLMDALRELAEHTSELNGIRCLLKCRKPVVASDGILAGHVYRIAQEAVHNAIKHGRARTITISLRSVRNQLQLAIADDGLGIGRLSPKRKGLGLRIMQYRAALIRGSLSVSSLGAHGTEVMCSAPLRSGSPPENNSRKHHPRSRQRPCP